MEKKEFFNFFIEKGLKSPILDSRGIEKYNAGHKYYHLDHIYPIIEGWKKRIPAIDIANYKNLTLLFHEDNRNKSSKTSLTVEEFYKLIKK